jgi:N utilization substance protein A
VAKAILRRNEKIGRESYRPNDRIRAYVKDVRRETRGPQIFLSRTDPQFMAELFKMEVPEIYDGVIEIKAVARDPGSRAKIAVISYDNSIDPVGACVGMRGSACAGRGGELQGEKIDIIPWSEDQATFLVNALQPAEVTKVVFDEDAAPRSKSWFLMSSSVAGHRPSWPERASGQPADGLDIDILTEEEESKRRQAEFNARTKLFMDAWIWTNSWPSCWSPKASPIWKKSPMSMDELLSIDGVDEGTAE